MTTNIVTNDMMRRKTASLKTALRSAPRRRRSRAASTRTIGTTNTHGNRIPKALWIGSATIPGRSSCGRYQKS